MVHEGSWNEWGNCWMNNELTDVTQRSNGKQDSRVGWFTNYTTNHLQSLAPWKKLLVLFLKVLSLGAASWVMLAQGIWWSHSQTMGWDCRLWTGCRISLQSHKRELLFSHSVLSDSLQPHRLQHARLPCPSPSPGTCSNSYPLSWWSRPTISPSVVPFSSCLQSSVTWNFLLGITWQLASPRARDSEERGAIPHCSSDLPSESYTVFFTLSS